MDRRTKQQAETILKQIAEIDADLARALELDAHLRGRLSSGKLTPEFKLAIESQLEVIARRVRNASREKTSLEEGNFALLAMYRRDRLYRAAEETSPTGGGLLLRRPLVRFFGIETVEALKEETVAV